MGDQAVVVTGVLHRDGDSFATQYEIRRFKIGKFAFCAWCGPQPGDPPPGHYDLANGTLRCRFDPADYATPIESFVSYDVVPLEGDRTETFQFNREGFHIGAKEPYWDYQVGSLFHLVLPPKHLPFPEVESIEPQPTYGWQLINDRFAIGWQGSLFHKCAFRFRKVEPEVFEQQAEQLRRKIKTLSQGDVRDPSSKVQIDLDQMLAKHNPNPWKSGTFYLFVFVVVAMTIAAIGYFISWYALPIILIATLLAVPIIGVSQALNDRTITEKGYKKIVLESYKRLPLLNQSKK